MWESIEPIVTPVVITQVGMLATVAMYYLRKGANWLATKTKASDAERDAMDALLAGMSYAQEELVLQLKRDSADGKLTVGERKRVRDAAIVRAKMLASDEGRKFLTTVTTERLDAAIKQILSTWSKGKNKGVTTDVAVPNSPAV